MYIPVKPAPMPAGHFPAHVEAACLVCEVKPEDLLAWSVRNDAVVLVLPGGQKVVFWVEGQWKAKQLPLPWEGEEDLTPGPFPERV